MPAPFILGWEEWLALPELGLPAVKAKVDTGARTSALHAFLIEPFGPPSAPMVRFGIHPIPARDDIEIYCSAPVVDRREVTSSNGEREIRFVIATLARIGERDWPIEVTLANRETMAYRMLLGRQAIHEDMFVDPSTSFRQPKLSYKLYRHLPRRDPVRRPLRLALLTTRPRASSARSLEAAAADRGHVLEILDVDRLALVFEDGGAGLVCDGTPLAHYDGVIGRVSGRARAAIIRQLELRGSVALNGADAVARLADRLAVLQALTRAHLSTAEAALAEIAPDDTTLGQTAADDEPTAEVAVAYRGPSLAFVVIGDAIAAVVETRHGHEADVTERALEDERRLALAAARALDLGLATVTIAHAADHPVVTAVSALPALTRIERLTGSRLSVEVIAALEARVRSWVRRTPTPDAEGTMPPR